jgi:elongation factor Ts
MSVTTEQVKELRKKTGAGLMDCKRALTEANGDLEKAVDILRKKGIEIARKREDKAAQEGTIAAYVHGGDQIGVLVEVNCETDFVARTEEFREFAHNVAMQVAAQQPEWVAPEDVPEQALERERQVLREQAEQEGKPQHIVEKIVEGRLSRFYERECLLKQPYIRDDSVTIEDKLNDLITACGEKVVIRRFVRFQVGEQE